MHFTRFPFLCVDAYAGVYAANYMAVNAFSFSLTSFLIGRYNMKANAATNVNNVFSGTFNFSPVVGAFVADALWGRFRTLLFGTAVGVLVSCDQSHYSSISSCSVVLRHHNRTLNNVVIPKQQSGICSNLKHLAKMALLLNSISMAYKMDRSNLTHR